MNLWIRSQDKENLLMVDEYLSIGEITYKMDYIKNSHNRPFYIESSNCILGFYSTKERALEVLDRIHSCLQTNCAFELYSNIGKFSDNFNEKYNVVPVYQMPEN